MRWTLPALAGAALLAAGCATAPGAAPAGPVESCVLVGGPKAPAEIRAYESNPYGSPGGQRIYIGLINRNERQTIQTRTGRIWYAFRWHEGAAWMEGFESPCSGGQLVPVPP